MAVAVVVGAFLAIRTSDPADDPRVAVTTFLRAWHRGDTAAMARLVVTRNPIVAETYRQQSEEFGGWPTTRIRRLTSTKSIATARFETRFLFKSGQAWTYRGVLTLVHGARGWRVRWTPATVHPLLTATTKFATTRTMATRAPILAEDATPLTEDAPVVTIGIEPRRMRDRAETTQALRDLAGVDPTVTAARLDAPGVQPDYFVEITTIPRAQYDLVRDRLYPVPGVVFRTTTQRQAATPQLGAHVVGRVGPITAELLTELGPSYRAGDVVGLDGLERVFQARLAGAASHTIAIVDAKDKVVHALATTPGVAPAAVRTTLDLATQRGAEAAIGATAPAALVAVRPSDGAIRAVVSTPVTEPFNRALDGVYPPGSTFKVITAAALLEHGTTPATVANCPPTITVNGRTFRNFEGESAPALPFSEAFAISCNTAFIGLAEPLPPDALGTAAREFGFGITPRLGLAAQGGAFPKPSDATEHVAAAIGQGRVTASPLTMAGVAATVASGRRMAPSLIIDPAPTLERAAPSTEPSIDTNVIESLRSLMLGVVGRGTGTAAGISGQSIGGKTGTAEFGTDVPPKTHAWFIGFRNDLAFAVLVEEGGVGGRVAAPIARTFLASSS